MFELETGRKWKAGTDRDFGKHRDLYWVTYWGQLAHTGRMYWVTYWGQLAHTGRMYWVTYWGQLAHTGRMNWKL